MRREERLVNSEIYHIFNKSIADFKIFNSNRNFSRMKDMLKYYQMKDMPIRFSQFMELAKVKESSFVSQFNSVSQDKEKLVQIVAYCFMPTHFHLILKQLKERGISIFMSNIQNSYSRYFNIRHKRKGPLWEGRFKSVLVATDEQLLHLTRYVHLNPVTGYLVNNPQDWPASSYQEYLLKVDDNDRICNYDDILKIEPSTYMKFVEDRTSYQRELAKIKSFIFE